MSKQTLEIIKYFLNSNIHMVWGNVERTQKVDGQNLMVQLGKYDVPIVQQWGKQMGTPSECLIIEVDNFKTINEFADFVNAL